MVGPTLPDPVATGSVLATVNDWRAIMVVFMFIIASLLAFVVWREFSLVGLRKAVDRVADSLWALKLSIAEDRVLSKEDRKLNLEDRVLVQEDRALSREERAASRKEREK